MTDFAWPPDYYCLPLGAPGAVYKPSAKPCPKCGTWVFLVVVQLSGLATVMCPNCCRLKPGDRVLGSLDRERWVFQKRA